MKLKTNTGIEREVIFADISGITGNLLAEFYDERPLQQIAAELDGATAFERMSDNQGNKTFTGYSEMQSIVRHRDRKVLVTFTKPTTGE